MTQDEKNAVRRVLKAWQEMGEADDPTDMNLFWVNYGAEIAENNLYTLCENEHEGADGPLRADYLFRVAERWERMYRKPASVLTA